MSPPIAREVRPGRRQCDGEPIPERSDRTPVSKSADIPRLWRSSSRGFLILGADEDAGQSRRVVVGLEV
jgi:hypothetical protein